MNPAPVRLGITVLLPFLFVPWVWEVRESPRQHLVFLLAAGIAAAAAWRGELRHRLGWPALALIAAVALASAASEEPLRSLFGPFPHGDSALGVVAAVIVLSLSPPRSELPAWCAAGCAVVVVQVLVAAVQHFALGAAPTGTLGHPAFLAALCMALAPVALGWCADARARWERLVASASLVCAGAGLGLCGRRAAVAAALLACGLVVARLPRRRRFLVPAVAGAVALALVGGLATASSFREVRALERFLGHEETYDSSLATRLESLRVAISGVRQHPILGAGFGTFADRYAAEKSAELHSFEGRAHSIALEIALGAGLVGLVALLLAVAAWARRALRRVSAADEPDAGRLAGCAACGAGYLLMLCVSIDQPGVTVWAAGLAGFAVGVPPLGASGSTWARAAACALLAAAGVASIVPLAGMLALGRARHALSDGDAAQALVQIRRAEHLLAAPCRAQLLEASLLQGARDPAAGAQAIRVLEACLAAHPHAPLVRLRLGLALHDAQEIERANEVLEEARAEAPTHVPTLRACARARAQAGHLVEALAVADQAMGLAPEDPEVQDERGRILLQLGRREEAVAAFRRAALADPGRAEYRADLERATRRGD